VSKEDKRASARGNNPLTQKHETIYQDEDAPQPTTSLAFKQMMEQRAIKQQVEQGNAIVSMQKGIIEIRGCKMTPTGLTIPDNASTEDLHFVATVISELEGALQWMIGDIVAFSEQLGYGDITEMALWFDKAPQTLMNWGSVCRFFGGTSRHREILHRRRAKLTFSHHAEVSGRENAEELLDKAEEGNWSVARLRKEISKDLLQEDEATSTGFADRETRNRMNRVWRAVSGGDLNNLKQDDIRLLRDWLNQLESQVGK
jgi:hypothetical protein